MTEQRDKEEEIEEAEIIETAEEMIEESSESAQWFVHRYEPAVYLAEGTKTNWQPEYKEAVTLGLTKGATSFLQLQVKCVVHLLAQELHTIAWVKISMNSWCFYK